MHRSTDDSLAARVTALVSTDDGDGDGGREGERGRDGAEHRGEGDCPSPGSFAPATAAQLVAADGATTACIEGAPTLPAISAGGARSGVSLGTVVVDGHRFRVAGSAWPGGGTLELGRDIGEVEEVLGGLRTRLAIFVGLATLLAAALGWAVATWVVRPIVRLRDSAAHIAATLDLSTPVDVKASGEVGDLAASFAAMVGAVGRSQEQQRRLVSDASHEMRTPLTSLRSNLELIGRLDRLPPAERREVVDDVLADVDELASMLAALVDLSSDLAAAEPEEAVRLGDLARAVAHRAERRTGRPVGVDELDALDVHVRPRQIERAIANLVENAVKYSPAGSPIDVIVRGAELTVQDNGPGVGEDDLPRIFDRFYRAVEMRTQPGSGLGLSIVDEIVRSHGGRVFARNRDGGGLAIGFILAQRGPGADR